MRVLIILDSAISDLHEAYKKYEEALPGLGMRFLETCDEYYDLLLMYPESASEYRRNIRQGRLLPFPYLVMYKIYLDRVVISSVVHNKQHPTKRTRKKNRTTN